MTVDRAPRDVARAAHRRGARSTARRLVAIAWIIGPWFWAVTFAVCLLLGYLAERSADVEMDGVVDVVLAARVFLLVIGIVLPLTIVERHVVAGATRRSLAHGVWWAAGFLGVTFTLAGAFVSWAIWRTFQAQGWSTRAGQAELWEGGSAADVVVVLAPTALANATYLLAGAAIGLAYYRWGGIVGTLVLVVLLVPFVLVEVALAASSLAVVVGGALLATCLAAAALLGIVRSVVIRPHGS